MEEMKRLCKLYNKEKKKWLKEKYFKPTRELKKISKQIEEVTTKENVTLLIKYNIFYVLIFLDFEKFKEELKNCKYKMSKEITNLLHYREIVNKCYLPKVKKSTREFVDMVADSGLDFDDDHFTPEQIVDFLKVMSYRDFSDSLKNQIIHLSMTQKEAIKVVRKYHPHLINLDYFRDLCTFRKMNLIYLF